MVQARRQEGWAGSNLNLASVVQNRRSSFLSGKYAEQRETKSRTSPYTRLGANLGELAMPRPTPGPWLPTLPSDSAREPREI